MSMLGDSSDHAKANASTHSACVQARIPARVLSVPVAQSPVSDLPPPQASARAHRTSSPLRRVLLRTARDPSQSGHPACLSAVTS